MPNMHHHLLRQLFYLGDEEEFYQGEIRDMVLGTLDEALSATEKATRKADVLEDILENNPYYHLSDERKQRIKALFICCIIKIPKVADKNGESCISILEKIAG